MRMIMAVILGLLVSVSAYRGAAYAQQKGAVKPVVQSDSEKMRAKIEQHAAKGEKDRELALLEEVVVDTSADAGLRTWAAGRMVKTAREEGRLKDVLVRVKAAERGSSDIALRKTIADECALAKEWGEVVPLYEEMKRDNPAHPDLQARLVDFYLLNGQADKAVAILEPLVEQNPSDRARLDMLANAYVQAGMKDKAVAAFKKRVDMQPWSSGVHGWYAQALQDLGYPDESLKEWRTAKEIDPSNGYFQRKIDEISAVLKQPEKKR